MDFKVAFGNVVYNMVPNGFVVYEDQIVIRIFGENISVDDIEKELSKPENLQLITIYLDNQEQTVISKYTQFTVLQEIRKKINSTFERYNEDSLLERTNFNEIEITVRSPKALDLITEVEATMEYIAIMADIDINEE